MNFRRQNIDVHYYFILKLCGTLAQVAAAMASDTNEVGAGGAQNESPVIGTHLADDQLLLPGAFPKFFILESHETTAFTTLGSVTSFSVARHTKVIKSSLLTFDNMVSNKFDGTKNHATQRSSDKRRRLRRAVSKNTSWGCGQRKYAY